MSKQRVIKYVRHPAFSAAQLTSRNPLLDIGEVVFELDGSNKPTKFKVGPGRWNDLPYFVDNIFTLSTSVSNPIGDAKGVLLGQSSRQILEKMLNPYQIPSITGITNNAGGSFASVRTLEIGQVVSGTINVNYIVANATNLLGATPIVVSAGNIFSNEGNFSHSGSLALTLGSSLNPSTIATYNINVSLVHQQGTTSPVSTTFRFYPKLIWGTTAVANPTSSDIIALTQKQTLISNAYRRDYSFQSTGYCVVAIPAMLNPTAMTFTDVTDPNAPAGFSMENLGTITINNGVGTYSYVILRSTYFITASNSILRIA